MAPKQWGAIRKLPSGRWQASYSGPDGTRYTAPSTFSDEPARPGLKARTGRDLAEKWLREQRVDIEAGRWVSPTVLERQAQASARKADAERFGVYADTWVEQRRNRKGEALRPKTRHEYERQLSGGLARFRNDLLTDITTARVRKWHSERAKAGATAAGAEARLLRAIMNTALVDGIITKNPVDANLTRSQTGVKHRPPTIDELTVMLDEVGPFFRLGVLLAAYGGLRIGEWRALRRRDFKAAEGRYMVNVDRAAQYITGMGWVVGPPKSAEGVRVVPLPSGLTDDVKSHLDEFVGAFPDDLVFPAAGSEFIHDRQFNRYWNAARDAAGVRVPVRWDGKKRPNKWASVVREHDLRAFAGTAFSQSGATLKETMVFLGHSTTAAAMAYQATTGREAEIADRMPLPVTKPRPVRRID